VEKDTIKHIIDGTGQTGTDFKKVRTMTGYLLG
jgi:hypothetical protein